MVLSCPQEYYESVLCPLLGPMFAYMLQVRSSSTHFLCLLYPLLAHYLLSLSAIKT